ncbi:DUF5343 domain-containing protein [Ciceribacter sp. L1K23]|uniref:DUF5343 domain-containing protein n=1 Tax=Ciceribacter sp. L1K23 TaxID=2820276 RepID=UPI001B83FB0A|nr:DUF5343 domain-containing protein [Ciceribacter sp. L1K23]MBR0556320.1 DUF5343 domain-containing protein [Ciceribacter sp. L1K23]
MASHPYISGAGNIAQMIGFLRKNFPATVNSETVKKFGLASNNESYVINALQFIGVLDSESKRTEKGHDVFVLDDSQFPSAFEGLIRDAYKDLFDLRGDDAWSLTKSELTSYFRTTDKTSEAIGSRQASVFIMFRGMAGHEQAADRAPSVGAKAPSTPKAKPTAQKKPAVAEVKAPQLRNENSPPSDGRKDVALTVRIEINLPANGSQETYDAIFKSIRANLINE